MPRFTPNFSDFKLGCDACGEFRKLERHHIGREFLFVSACGDGELSKTKWYKKFKERYHEFRSYDVRRICNPCHREIHHEYNVILRRHNRSMKHKNISDYTIEEVKALRKKFRQAYFKWRKDYKRKGKYKYASFNSLKEEKSP